MFLLAPKRLITRQVFSFIALGSAIALLGTFGCAPQTKSSPAAATTETAGSVQAATPQSGSSSGFQLVTLLENLEHPWGFAWLPTGNLLITERPGRLRIVRNGVLDPTPIAGIPDIFAESQGGLLDVVVHPRFANNRLVYLTYSHGVDSENRTRVARARFNGKSLINWQVIFEVSQTKDGGQHFGSRLLWLPDGTLLVSIGDGGNPPIELEGALIREQAQNLESHLGKVIRLNADGSIPVNNPFINDSAAVPEVWSYGHRNIQGLALDPIKNQVWATEHGAKGGDEVNLIAAGENYGWPLATHSQEYSGGPISPDTSLPGMIDPKVIWTPSIAPSGLTVYTGEDFPEWQGNLFAGGLVSQDLRRIEVDDSGNVVSEESLLIGQRVREVQQGPDGLLYVLTDESNGQLLRLEPLND
ncbi:MAG: PQQ-dependent sugar dehydrogenase [Leptolyngbyaceae cyanobacterium MAG.088]|nr:PQQ-dependent sugar dehydrogenase [Leptolyngbyaceae cyanobacterium MAG.088]